MAEGADPDVVESIVDADPTRCGQGDAALATVAGDGDQRRQVPARRQPSGVIGGTVPRDREGQQARMTRCRLDDVPLAPIACLGELHGARRLHRAAPDLDRLGHAPGDDRDRVQPQVPADRPMDPPAGLQDRRAPEGAGRKDHLGRADDEAANRRAHRTRPGGQHRHPRRRVLDQEVGPDAGDPSALQEESRHPYPVDDPRATRDRLRQMDPQAAHLRAARAPERARPAIRAGAGISVDRRSLPAEGRGAPKDRGILGRDALRGGDSELGLDDRAVPVPLRSIEPLEPMVRRPGGPHGQRGVDAGHPVDEGPAPDPRAGKHADRAVPGREQAVIQVQARERVQLGPGHRRLVDRRSCLEHDHGPARRRQLRRDDASAGARADHDDVRLQDDRIGARPAIDRRGADRRHVRRRRRCVRLVADLARGAGSGRRRPAPRRPGSRSASGMPGTRSASARSANGPSAGEGAPDRPPSSARTPGASPRSRDWRPGPPGVAGRGAAVAPAPGRPRGRGPERRVRRPGLRPHPGRTSRRATRACRISAGLKRPAAASAVGAAHRPPRSRGRRDVRPARRRPPATPRPRSNPWAGSGSQRSGRSSRYPRA